MATDSILDSTKNALGLTEDVTPFDTQVIMYINGVFSDLEQLGIGPAEGFEIEDSTAVWSDFIGDAKPLNSVKTYMYLRVRLLFDPPATSFVQDSMQKQIERLEWRLNVQRENVVWAAQKLTEVVDAGHLDHDGVLVFDGGTP